jgi:hypothetical protein
LAKYSDDAKYVSAFNRALKASNQAKLLLQDLNRATPGTPKHADLKAKYDSAKDTADKAEAERVARKAEIDADVAKQKSKKETAKKKESLKTELPQLEYQLQVAKNKGDAAGITAAELAISAARDKAAGVVPKTPEQVAQEEAGPKTGTIGLTDFLKSAVGSVEKTKKLQQALKTAGVYEGPVNGIFNADVLLPAAERAEEKLDRYASLGITFTDRFEGYSRLASTKGGDGLGTGGPSVTQYPAISSETDALAAINAVFNAELGRDATSGEFSALYPKLMAAQRKNPSTQTVRTVNGKKVVETVTGLDTNQFLVTEIRKNPATKAEIDTRLKSAQSLNRQDLEKTAIANGLDLDKNFGAVVDTWVKRVDNGEDIDIFKNLIRNTAKIGLPDKVAGLLDNGVDLETVYSPYKRLMASTLEIAPDSISIDDSTLRMAIGPDKEMSLYDFQRSLRKDPRWQYTDQARQSVSEAALGVLRDFGFTG